MIYITGDTHGKFSKLINKMYFTEDINEFYDIDYKNLTKNDYVIICGDFGGVWRPSISEESLAKEDEIDRYLEILNPDFDWSKECEYEKNILDGLENLPFTILFVTGNHENYNRLATYPDKEWHGGVVKEIRPHVLLLKRGYVFDIEGYKFLAMGGARSHDIQSGVFELTDPDIREKIQMYTYFRINELSWWEEEIPSEEEKQRCIDTLEANNWTVDFVLTHEAPGYDISNISFYHRRFRPDSYALWLQEIKDKLTYKHWFFGHYHEDRSPSHKDHCVYYSMNKLDNYIDN